MKADIAAKALQRLKDQLSKAKQIEALGVNTLDYDTPFVCIIEELICALFAKDEKEFDKVLEAVQWWLDDEEKEKTLIHDLNRIDVFDPKEFVKILTTNHYLLTTSH